MALGCCCWIWWKRRNHDDDNHFSEASTCASVGLHITLTWNKYCHLTKKDQGALACSASVPYGQFESWLLQWQPGVPTEAAKMVQVVGPWPPMWQTKVEFQLLAVAWRSPGHCAMGCEPADGSSLSLFLPLCVILPLRGKKKDKDQTSHIFPKVSCLSNARRWDLSLYFLRLKPKQFLSRFIYSFMYSFGRHNYKYILHLLVQVATTTGLSWVKAGSFIWISCDSAGTHALGLYSTFPGILAGT